MIKDMFVLGQLLPGEEYIKGYPDNCFPHWLRMIDQAKRNIVSDLQFLEGNQLEIAESLRYDRSLKALEEMYVREMLRRMRNVRE